MTTQRKSPIRIILTHVESDARGVAVETDYATVDIDSAEIEKLLYVGRGSFRIRGGEYKVVGAELLDVEGAKEKYDADDPDSLPF